MNTLVTVTFDDMQTFLTDPASRILDSRMLEFFDHFGYSLQVLRTDNTIWEVIVKPKFVLLEDGGVQMQDIHQFRKEALDLFRLQYQNSPRQNPALYGLLDAADAESRVEQTLPIQSR